MPIQSAGSPVSERLLFNSGYVTFASNQMVDVDNISLDISFSEKELRALNSIKMTSHKRATLKCGMKAKIKSMSKELFIQTFGATTIDGLGELISVKDGQLTSISNPVFTAYIDDDVLKPIQFQFSDAVYTANPLTANLESFGEIDFTLTAKDVSIYYYDIPVFRALLTKASIR